ncbi:hypothetical protein B0H34DRAFT_861975 [Crassisporium funariophilum]|nr:hypothetical protein B0H34DRAFT_861975 [Crassisporium funariophilum]
MQPSSHSLPRLGNHLQHHCRYVEHWQHTAALPFERSALRLRWEKRQGTRKGGGGNETEMISRGAQTLCQRVRTGVRPTAVARQGSKLQTRPSPLPTRAIPIHDHHATTTTTTPTLMPTDRAPEYEHDVGRDDTSKREAESAPRCPSPSSTSLSGGWIGTMQLQGRMMLCFGMSKQSGKGEAQRQDPPPQSNPQQDIASHHLF